MGKLNKSDLQERVDHYRKIYPDKTLYFTEDGNCFLHEQSAKNHARQEKIKMFTDEPAKAPVKKNGNDDTKREAAIAKLMDIDLEKDVSEDLAKALCNDIGLKPVSEKPDDILVALEEFKQSIKRD